MPTAVYEYRCRASVGGSSLFQLLYWVLSRKAQLDLLLLFPKESLRYRNMKLTHVAHLRAERRQAQGRAAVLGNRWDEMFRVGDEVLVSKTSF